MKTSLYIQLRQLQEKADKAHHESWNVVVDSLAGCPEDIDYIASASPEVVRGLIQMIYQLSKENEDMKFQLSLFDDDLK